MQSVDLLSPSQAGRLPFEIVGGPVESDAAGQDDSSEGESFSFHTILLSILYRIYEPRAAHLTQKGCFALTVIADSSVGKFLANITHEDCLSRKNPS